jgi:hypothetical protein
LAYSADLQDAINYSGTSFRLGCQYLIRLDKSDSKGMYKIGDRTIILGAYYVPNSNLKSISSRLYRSLSSASSVKDTISYETDIKRSGTMPSELGFGITYEALGKLRLSAEYSLAHWSEYQNEAKKEQLADTRRMAFGVEYTPNALSYNNNWQRARYRLGIFSGQDPRSNNGQQLTNSGFTLGLGLPVVLPRQTISYFNMALEAGRFGSKNGLKENYIKFLFGFTLNDSSWFFKRKFG